MFEIHGKTLFKINTPIVFLQKIVPEISLKEPTKVCEKCFKKESEKKSVSLYDNY